jgi:hypothetical protein
MRGPLAWPCVPDRQSDHPAGKFLVTGLLDEVVPAHIAECLAYLVPAFRATLPAEPSGHALDERGEHRCLLTDTSRMILEDHAQQGQRTPVLALEPGPTPGTGYTADNAVEVHVHGPQLGSTTHSKASLFCVLVIGAGIAHVIHCPTLGQLAGLLIPRRSTVVQDRS